MQRVLGVFTLMMGSGSVAFALMTGGVSPVPPLSVAPAPVTVELEPTEPEMAAPSTVAPVPMEPEARADLTAALGVQLPNPAPVVAPEELIFVVNEDGVVIAESFQPDDGALDAATTTTTPPATTTIGEETTTTEGFGEPRLWLGSVSVVAAELNTGSLPVVEIPRPDDARGCYLEAKALEVSTRNEIAGMVTQLFQCMATVSGLDEKPPTAGRSWDGANRWGFENLAQQVGAEAVVVAYCESKGFAGHAVYGNNPWGYGGVFQMGGAEMARFGGRGLSKYDPVDNTYAAANYFLYQYRSGSGWGGWSPWAVVNTNFDDEINNQVRVPVLPRFGSTDPGYRGRRGPELPEWAVDPSAWEVPGWGGCPFGGGRWPTAQPLP